MRNTLTVRAGENFHIVLWLAKDVAWLQDWKVLGISMFLPTFLMAIWIAWRLRSDRGELLHALAVVCWIAANGVWMIGEFWYADRIRHLAVPFFVAGLLCVGWYYLVLLPLRSGGRGPVLTRVACGEWAWVALYAHMADVEEGESDDLF